MWKQRHLDKQAHMLALEIFKIKKEGATPRDWGLYSVYMSWHQARGYTLEEMMM